MKLKKIFVLLFILSITTGFTFHYRDPRLPANGLTIENDHLWFRETRTINVPLFYNIHDQPHQEVLDDYWVKWVQSQMLSRHNVYVNFIPIGRSREGSIQRNMLQNQMPIDIVATREAHRIGTDYFMDLYPILTRYLDFFPNLHYLLGDNLFRNLDIRTNQMNRINERIIVHGNYLAFVRYDWLNALNIPVPTNFYEFEAMLYAFHENRELLAPLAGGNPEDIIPFRLGSNVRTSAGLIAYSFIPNNISDRQFWVYDVHGQFMQPNIWRQTVSILNRWYHDGLLWNDFVYFQPGRETPNGIVRQGRVGAFIDRWDFPFREIESFIPHIQENIGPDATFIPINPFLNDEGIARHFMSEFLTFAVAKSILLPAESQEPMASLLYLDFISRLDVIEFLQFGYKNIHHIVHENGGLEPITEYHLWEENQRNISDRFQRNRNLTLTINGGTGMLLDDTFRTAATVAINRRGLVITAEQMYQVIIAGRDNRWYMPVTSAVATMHGPATSTSVMGNIRSRALIESVTADPDMVYYVFDSLFAEYMRIGGTRVLEERRQAWYDTFGDREFLRNH